MFSNLRHLTDDEDKEVYSLPTAYTVWMKWTSEGYSLVNPAQLPRISYYECSADGAVVYQPHEVWGNVLIHLLLNGLSRDSFGRLFRQKGTQLTVPIQVYGNKSEYNNIVETHKPGHIEIKPNLHKMVGLTIENGEDIQGTAKAYEAYNALEIPSFPQHQGEDLRILDAATASLVSLVKMGDIPIYIFARSVDKVTKLFNRLSLLNRVGTEGVCSCDPDDM
jgi:hypothetical protein